MRLIVAADDRNGIGKGLTWLAPRDAFPEAFLGWFENWYGKAEDFTADIEEADEYKVRRFFAWSGWLAATSAAPLGEHAPRPADTFLDHPDTLRLVNEYEQIGVIRPIPGSNPDYDNAAHNLAMLVKRAVVRRRHKQAKEGAS